MKRRHLFTALAGLVGAAFLPTRAADKAATPVLKKTKAQWKALLPENSYRVLFEEDTEPPFSHALNNEKRAGIFICLACNLPMFDSATKYDSGTGWPSFYQVLPKAIGTKTDTLLNMPRTEYHCSRCGGHHGHVFNDGPKPTGLRYCNNGLALRFIPKGEKLPALRT